MKLLHFTRDDESRRPVEYVVFTDEDDVAGFGRPGFSVALVAEIQLEVERGKELLPLDTSLIPE